MMTVVIGGHEEERGDDDVVMTILLLAVSIYNNSVHVYVNVLWSVCMCNVERKYYVMVVVVNL